MDRRVFIGAGAGILALGGAGVWLNSGPSSTPLPPLGAANAQATDDVDISGIVEMTMGDPNAPIELIEYASFTCPHCANFHQGPLKQLKSEFIETGKVHFIYRDVFFDRFGLWASMIARCGGTERFFGISDLLYTQQKEWLAGGDPETIIAALRKIGKVAGLSDEDLDACMADGDKAKSLIAWYQKMAGADEITSTPTLIIDGEKHSNMSYSDLKTLLNGKLES